MTILIFFLLMGLLGAFFAKKSGRNQTLWFFIVGLTGGWGLIALLLLVIAAYGQNPTNNTPKW